MLFFITQFVIAFVNVYLKGIQTQNIVTGDYKSAFITSLGMGASNVLFIGLIASDPWASYIPVSLGASLGVASSMYYKRNGLPLFKKVKQ